MTLVRHRLTELLVNRIVSRRISPLMARPSRHLDRALLAAGRELLPVHGCSGLTVRQVADAAGVNIGMFHYHFRSREAYLRAVMQGAYEEMFSQLTLSIAGDATASANLRAALRVVGRFVHANRALMGRILADALGGDEISREFVRDNFPRHLRVLLALVAAGQTAGELRKMVPMQAVAFCAGAIGAPILIGGAFAESAAADPAMRRQLEAGILSLKAIDERIDLAVAALAKPMSPSRRKGES
jgi:AcrR family transcriptional regulator